MGILDFVLNRSGAGELDAIAAAVERRRKDLARFPAGGTMNPARFAREMSEAVQKSIDGSMEGMRRSIRTFALDTLRREAPELTEEQIADLAESWIPGDKKASRGAGPAAGGLGGGDRPSGSSLGARGSALPAEVLGEMAVQFVAYSSGKMPPAEEASLRENIGDWPRAYWNEFSEPLRDLIRDFLEGRADEAAFIDRLGALLG